MKRNVVANSKRTIYVASIVDKTSKSLKDDQNIVIIIIMNKLLCKKFIYMKDHYF